MSKTLSNILTVFKVVRIIAKIVFILCIIGAVGCVIGLLSLPMAGAVLAEQELFGEVLDLPLAYLGCLVGIVSCVGEAIFAFLAERYFKRVLDAGTPFTFDGAKEVFNLGLASIIISVATSVLAGIFEFAVLLFSGVNASGFDVNMSVSISTGLFFLFLSIIFKHGAEVQQIYSQGTYSGTSYTDPFFDNINEQSGQEEQVNQNSDFDLH